MAAYYNEHDPFAAQWLRNLIAAGLIAAGDVDERSIVDVRADDLRGYAQCHFFAGIGGWSYAARLAGVDDADPIWTGSCPCQPFSAAGQQKGEADERHLWPEFRRLIAECRPPVVFGEQVASVLGRGWLGGKQGLQRLQDREAVVRVLSERNLFGRLPDALQGMLSSGRNGSQGARPEGEAQCGSPEMAASEPWRSAGSSGGASCAAEGPGMHDRSACDPGGDRGGRVPIDGYSVQLGRRPDVGQPFDRPDQERQGIHAGKHARSSLLHQCDGEHLGREQDSRDCGSHHGAAQEPFGGIATAPGIRIEAAAEFDQLAGVRSDLEALGYAVGAADLCAAGVGAPHIRQRLWWVAHASGDGRQQGTEAIRGREPVATWRGENGGVGDADRAGPQQGRQATEADRYRSATVADGGAERMADTMQPGWPEGRARPGLGSSAWSGGTLIPCADGKARRVGPGVQPMAHGVSARVGRLRGYGNAIVPQVAAEFIKACRGGCIA